MLTSSELEIGPVEIAPALGSPERGELADRAMARADAARAAFAAVVEPYLARVAGVTTKRLEGPRARKSTRWWTETKSTGYDIAPSGSEYKTLDADYVLPDSLVRELENPVRDVAMRVALDSAKTTMRALTPGSRVDNPFSIDSTAVQDAVEEAVMAIMGMAARHAGDVRKAILEADASADSLDEVLDRVEKAQRRGGAWLLMSGQTLANALVNEAALAQARALGSTHKQWLSRKDERVRPTHRIADGQIHRLDDTFHVGQFDLRFPADPADLPESFPEVAGCRCGMLFSRPDPRDLAVARELAGQMRPGSPTEAGRRLIRARVDTPAVPQALTEPVAVYRAVDTTEPFEPGARLDPSSVTYWSLVAPTASEAAAAVLALAIPTGATVAVVGDVLSVAAGASAVFSSVSPTVAVAVMQADGNTPAPPE